jgi:hypothetical protein
MSNGKSSRLAAARQVQSFGEGGLRFTLHPGLQALVRAVAVLV